MQGIIGGVIWFKKKEYYKVQFLYINKYILCRWCLHFYEEILRLLQILVYMHKGYHGWWLIF